MTTGELLNQESTVTNVSALIHLQNLEGTGSGVDHYFPYSEINVSMLEPKLTIEFSDRNLIAKFTDQNIAVKFVEDNLSVTFDGESNDINITC